jgi:hypothetical protein
MFSLEPKNKIDMKNKLKAKMAKAGAQVVECSHEALVLPRKKLKFLFSKMTIT